MRPLTYSGPSSCGTVTVINEPTPGSVGPGGECDDTTQCQDGLECINGTCQQPDPCAGVSCPEGQHCEDGVCISDDPVDPCSGVSCGAGEICENGTCRPKQPGEPCGTNGCPPTLECVDGTCQQPSGNGDKTKQFAFLGLLLLIYRYLSD